jgi:hypothetical protein
MFSHGGLLCGKVGVLNYCTREVWEEILGRRIKKLALGWSRSVAIKKVADG